MMAVVVTVFIVTLTWTHVVLVLMVLIVETGISLMELDCHSMEVVISMSTVELKRNRIILRMRSLPRSEQRCVIFWLQKELREKL